MNREIKFRAWDGEQMISPDYINRQGYACWKSNSIPETTNRVMQYTGLKDKNGKEIYDLDRVKIRRWLVEGKDYMDYNCDVMWNGWCYGLYIAGKQMWGLDPITARETEIIGNIYENR